MKRLLSVMLALMMLALPLIGMAETAPVSGLGFAGKYTAQGQRQVLDVNVELSDLLYQMAGIPEELSAPLKELLSVLTIEMVAQATDNMQQAGLRLLIEKDGENTEAADLICALDGKGVYASSSFLGDKPVRFTMEQLQTLLGQLKDQYMNMLVANGAMTQEQAQQMQGSMEAFEMDPNAALTALIGTPDLTGLQEAVAGLLEMGEPVAVTEKPEIVPFDAAGKMTVIIRKEKLAQLLSEAVKVIWSMPIVQQIAGQNTTEEELIANVSSVADVLAEDITIDLYVAEAGTPMFAVTSLPIKNGEQVQTMDITVLIEQMESGMHIAGTMSQIMDAENSVVMSFDETVVASEDSGAVAVTVDVDVTSGGQAFKPVQEIYNVIWSNEEALQTMGFELTYRVQSAPDAQPIGILVNADLVEADLGDHAEDLLTATVALEDIGELVKILVTGKTDLAEAYIVTEDALEPLSSETAMQEFNENLSSSLMGGLMKLMLCLPEGAQGFLVQMMNNTAK